MKITIAIDLMGGDKAPKSVIEGIKIALENHEDVHFICFGSKIAIKKAKKTLKHRCEFFESTDDISSEDKVSVAVRKKESSMSLAIKATQEGKTHATISSGNTGALMSLSKLYYRTIEEITRPAICTVIPTMQSVSVLLDMGANTECSPQNFLEFGIMGSAFLKSAFNIENPTVGILNIGTEENKGTALVQEAYVLFQNSPLSKNFTGFIEGDTLHHGKTNVIVTDGFTGNIVLKAMEGSGKTMKFFLKKYLMSSILGKIAVAIAYPCFKKIHKKIDPNNYNGAMFLGLNGITVKSHGSSNAKGFANAIKTTCNLVESGINDQLRSEIHAIHEEHNAESTQVNETTNNAQNAK